MQIGTGINVKFKELPRLWNTIDNMSEKEFSRAATFDDLKILIKALNQYQVPYLLIGGYALFAHGYHRATEDIDLLIPTGQETGRQLIKALMVLPDQAAKKLDPAWFDEAENIRLADEFVVDIMFSACGETYDRLLSYAETIKIDDIPIHTINLQGLLLTKQTVREKDKIDRIVLENALQAIQEESGTKKEK